MEGNAVDLGMLGGAVCVVPSDIWPNIVFDGATQRGLIYDRDGAGTLSFGDTLIDMTNLATNGALTNVENYEVQLTLEASEGGNVFNFTLNGGDLIDLI
jgi:hypothetical protein